MFLQTIFMIIFASGLQTAKADKATITLSAESKATIEGDAPKLSSSANTTDGLRFLFHNSGKVDLQKAGTKTILKTYNVGTNVIFVHAAYNAPHLLVVFAANGGEGMISHTRTVCFEGKTLKELWRIESDYNHAHSQFFLDKGYVYLAPNDTDVVKIDLKTKREIWRRRVLPNGYTSNGYSEGDKIELDTDSKNLSVSIEAYNGETRSYKRFSMRLNTQTGLPQER